MLVSANSYDLDHHCEETDDDCLLQRFGCCSWSTSLVCFSFSSLEFHQKWERLCFPLFLLMVVDTSFIYERELVVGSFLKDFPTRKGSSLQLTCNPHSPILLCGADLSLLMRSDMTLLTNFVLHTISQIHCFGTISFLSCSPPTAINISRAWINKRGLLLCSLAVEW